MTEATLQAIIFDVDGTLAETEDVHRRAFNRAFAEFGHDWTWDVPRYKDLLKVTGGKNRIRLYLEESHPNDLARPDLDDHIAQLHQRKTALYAEIMADGGAGGGVELKPGVENLIRSAHDAGMLIAIATTTTPGNITALFRATMGEAVLDWFAVIGHHDNAPTLKPDPEVYHLVLAKLGLAPEACLAIEDSGNGIRAAHAAGIPCLVVKSEFTKTGDTTGTLGVLDTLAGVGLADLAALHGRNR